MADPICVAADKSGQLDMRNVCSWSSDFLTKMSTELWEMFVPEGVTS